MKGRRGARVPQKFDWEGGQVIMQSLTGAAAFGAGTPVGGYALNPTLVRDFYISPTVYAIRSFLTFRLRSGTGPISADGYIGYGLIRWTDVNDTAPTAAELPSPLNNIDLDWIARWVSPVYIGDAANSNYFPNTFDNTHLIKARRKLEASSGILAVGQVIGATGGAATFDILADHRFLLRQV